MDPIRPLCMAAIYERLGQRVGSDQMIKIALDAVLAGIDSPAQALTPRARAISVITGGRQPAGRQHPSLYMPCVR